MSKRYLTVSGSFNSCCSFERSILHFLLDQSPSLQYNHTPAGQSFWGPAIITFHEFPTEDVKHIIELHNCHNQKYVECHPQRTSRTVSQIDCR